VKHGRADARISRKQRPPTVEHLHGHLCLVRYRRYPDFKVASRRLINPSARRVVALASALAVIGSAVGTSSIAAAHEGQARTAVTGGTHAQRVLLREILHRMGGTQISGIHIKPSAMGVQLLMQPTRLDRSRTNLSIRLRWDAEMTAYSFAKLSDSRGFPLVMGYSILGQPGTFRESEPRVKRRFDREQIVPPVGMAVRRSGARLLEFNVFRPSEAVVAVVVSTPRPAHFIRNRLGPIITALIGVHGRIDGFYVAVTNSAREVVFAYARTDRPRSSTSTLFVRPDLQGCAENLAVGVEVAPDTDPPCPRG